MTLELRRHEKELQKLEKNKCPLHTYIAQQPNLAAQVKTWKTGHRHNGISVPTYIRNRL
jgi:hypothetical protein